MCPHIKTTFLISSVCFLFSAPAFSQSANATEEWIRLPIRILFEEGSAELDHQDRATLRRLMVSIAHRTDIVQFRVEGHLNTYSSEATNSRLALERARAVIGFFVNTLGMPPDLFREVSHGNSRPIIIDGHAQNRRVEMSMLVRRVQAP